MTPDASHAVAVVFLSDLRLVSSLGALGAYGAWLVSGRAQAASLGRLALTVVLAATLAMLALAGAGQLPLREWFLVAWVAVWLAAGMVFSLTVLGGIVAAGAVLLIGWSYAAPSDWGGTVGTPLSDLARYWAHLRDGLAAVAAASVSLAIAAGVTRARVGERRASQAYAPNDLVAASRVLARAGALLGGLGLLAAGLAWQYDPAGALTHGVRVVGLAGLLAVSFGWLAGGRGGQAPGWRLALFVLGGTVVCAWLFAGARVAAYLTPGGAGP
jgi:hypothetical protein